LAHSRGARIHFHHIIAEISGSIHEYKTDFRIFCTVRSVYGKKWFISMFLLKSFSVFVEMI